MKTLYVLLTVLLSFVTVSCEEKKDSEDQANERILERLSQCGVVTAGPGDPFLVDNLANTSDSCIAGCLQEASCAAIEMVWCHATRDPDMELCFAACPPLTEYDCGDGIGSYTERDRCDGWALCDDGTDEQSCPPDFVCDDGGTARADKVCDFYPDCNDGSDEYGCATDSCY